MKFETSSIEEAEKVIKEHGIHPEHKAKRSQSGAMIGSVYIFDLPDKPEHKVIEENTQEKEDEVPVDIRVKRRYTRRG